ncbi:MAG TPA: hypothetical protein VFT74_07620 [Isosphaeraceae bacterium]|nr:hypothetical protein [Isosphaeraceae bacterium]
MMASSTGRRSCRARADPRAVLDPKPVPEVVTAAPGKSALAIVRAIEGPKADRAMVKVVEGPRAFRVIAIVRAIEGPKADHAMVKVVEGPKAVRVQGMEPDREWSTFCRRSSGMN